VATLPVLNQKMNGAVIVLIELLMSREVLSWLKPFFQTIHLVAEPKMNRLTFFRIGDDGSIIRIEHIPPFSHFLVTIFSRLANAPRSFQLKTWKHKDDSANAPRNPPNFHRSQLYPHQIRPAFELSMHLPPSVIFYHM